MKNRNYLIEEIRKKTIALEKENWHIEYAWIRSHVGHLGNELIDKLAKEAGRIATYVTTKSQKVE
jgi:ribonuclease HI